MNFLASLDANIFLYILSSISEGLNALDTMVCTGCCATLDHIVTYLFKWISKSNKKGGNNNNIGTTGSREGEACLKVLDMHPEILQQMLSTILNIIMFEDCRNQWSMSRPLLGLILLNEEYFQSLRSQIIQSQPLDKQPSMALWFDNLMEGIERNLLTKNRDRLVIRILLMKSGNQFPSFVGSLKTCPFSDVTSTTPSKDLLYSIHPLSTFPQLVT